jgi:hypothetical protein
MGTSVYNCSMFFKSFVILCEWPDIKEDTHYNVLTSNFFLISGQLANGFKKVTSYSSLQNDESVT